MTMMVIHRILAQAVHHHLLHRHRLLRHHPHPHHHHPVNHHLAAAAVVVVNPMIMENPRHRNPIMNRQKRKLKFK